MTKFIKSFFSVLFIEQIVFPYLSLARLDPIDFSVSWDSVKIKDGPFQPHHSYGDNRFRSSLKPKAESEGDPFNDVPFHSGYINVGNEGGEMFYWYFPNENQNAGVDSPFIIWLTGGPGCSSELAALTENGPFIIQPNVTVTRNQYSWSNVADVVYIDQPLGTGFSSVGNPRNYVTNEKVVAEDMSEFLVQFLDLYPKLKNKPFYITGESYAGHYIPSVAHLLLKRPIEELNLQGVAIGNGWVDPRSQYPAYADFAFEHNLVGEIGYRLAQKGLEACVQLIDQGLWALAIIQCNAIVSGLLGKKNPYDVRLDCETPPLCYNTTSLNEFMNRDDVQIALGVHKKWSECNGLVYALMLGDWITEMRTKVGELLNAGKKVLIYNGDQDFVCNWRGGQNWVNNIDWEKKDVFVSKRFTPWNVNGKQAGEFRQVDNLTFLRVYDAGHMVPMDQPVNSLSMIKSFLSNNFAPAENQPRNHNDGSNNVYSKLNDFTFNLQESASAILAIS